MVIVGSGICGGVAARTLRESGYEGRVLLIGNEPGEPFGRPPLSKTYLRSEEDLSGWLVEPPDWYELEGRLLGFASEPVVTAVQASSTGTCAR